MKKTYITPEFITHGNVQSLTQVLGPDNTADTLSISGNLIGDNNTGSRSFEA